VGKAMNVLVNRLGPRAEIRKWLEDNIGEKARFFTNGPTGDWHHDLPLSASTMTFYFRNPDQAVLFKLTWA
jgi:hypothetical protein